MKLDSSIFDINESVSNSTEGTPASSPPKALEDPQQNNDAPQPSPLIGDEQDCSQEIVLDKSMDTPAKSTHKQDISETTSPGSIDEEDSSPPGSPISNDDSFYEEVAPDQQGDEHAVSKKNIFVKEKAKTPTVITMMRSAIDPYRKKVKSTDNISKLAPISKKDKTNQCYVNAVFQMLIGMSELWEDVIFDASKDSMTNYILNHPFTITGLVMGGLMKGAVEDNSLPKPIKSDVLFSCRKQHLDFKPYSQEDASEYMGQYMDRLIEEKKNGTVGRNYKIKSCTRRKCMSCNHEYCGNTVEDNYFNMGIPDEFWNKGSCSLQDLINRTFDCTSSLDGFKCPNETCGIQKKTIIRLRFKSQKLH